MDIRHRYISISPVRVPYLPSLLLIKLCRLKVVRRHAVRHDEDVATFCARLDRLTSGWCLVRLLDMQSKYVGATLLCEFTLL